VPYEMDEGSGAAEGDPAVPSLSPQEMAALATLWLSAAVPDGHPPPETSEQAKTAIDGLIAALPVRAHGRKPTKKAA